MKKIILIIICLGIVGGLSYYLYSEQPWQPRAELILMTKDTQRPLSNTNVFLQERISDGVGEILYRGKTDSFGKIYIRQDLVLIPHPEWGFVPRSNIVIDDTNYFPTGDVVNIVSTSTPIHVYVLYEKKIGI